jgi:PAS domain S-box-containing protein
MPEELFELLRKILIFSKLDSDSLGAIVPLFKKRTYHHGDVLFRENTFGDKLYIIIDGEVEITKREKIGEETTRLALRRKGDIFGEMSLLDEEPRFASAKAAKETQVLELSKSNFLTMLSDNPLVAYQIMRVLSSRLRQSDLHMIDELRKKNKQLSEAYDNLKSYAEALTQSHQELNQSKSFLERIISTSPYSIVVTGLDGTISLFNKTARREYGYASEEVIGKEIKTLRGGANLLNLDELIEEALKREGIWQGEIIARKKDGEHFVADTIICNVKDRMGQISAILHISKDVTFEKNLNLQTLELERMATRGEMAAEVAHELNNYLQIVRGNLDLLSYDASWKKSVVSLVILWISPSPRA